MATLGILVFCISAFMVFAEEPVTQRVDMSTDGAEDVSGVDLHSEDLVAISTNLYDVGQHYGGQEDQDDRYSHHSSSTSGNSYGDHDKYKKYDESQGNRNQKSGESKYGNHGNQDYHDVEKGIRDYGHTKKGFHNLYHKEEYGHYMKYYDNANYKKINNDHVENNKYNDDHHVDSYNKYGQQGENHGNRDRSGGNHKKYYQDSEIGSHKSSYTPKQTAPKYGQDEKRSQGFMYPPQPYKSYVPIYRSESYPYPRYQSYNYMDDTVGPSNVAGYGY